MMAMRLDVYTYNTNQYRILDVLNEHIIWFNMDVHNALPEQFCIYEFEDLLVSGLIEKCEDPFRFLALPFVSCSSKEQKIRDDRYEKISLLLNDPHYFLPKVRGRVAKEITAKTGLRFDKIIKFCRQYWQRGCTKNALLPDFKFCGGKGKKRVYKTKPGRPSAFLRCSEAIIDEEMGFIIERLIIKNYFGRKFSFAEVYRDIIGNLRKEIPGISEKKIPSKAQVYRYLYNTFPKVEIVKKRAAPAQFNKDFRTLTATAVSNVLGPGSQYELDATVADIYIVSEFDPNRILGRPTFYTVVDTFSGLIVGYYIGFEWPSYATAMQAIISAVTNKKIERCHELGFTDIDESQWPSVGLPESIIADRGELMSCQLDYIQKQHGIQIKTPPPYRADSRGIGERYFQIIQRGFKKRVDGVVEGARVKKQGGRDYRLDSNITIDEFEKIIVASILMNNCSRPLTRHGRDPRFGDEGPLTPLSMWNWGIENRTGSLTQVDPLALRLALQPKKMATTSDRGICIFGVYFNCPELINRGWFIRKNNIAKPKEVMVSYDSRCLNVIYILPFEHSDSPLVAHISDYSEEFKNQSLHEIQARQVQQRKSEGLSKRDYEDKIIQMSADMDELAKTARKRSKSKTSSKSEKIADIKVNRQQEIQQARLKNAYRELQPLDNHFISSDSINSQEESFVDPEIDALLKQQRDL